MLRNCPQAASSPKAVLLATKSLRERYEWELLLSSWVLGHSVGSAKPREAVGSQMHIILLAKHFDIQL